MNEKNNDLIITFGLPEKIALLEDGNYRIDFCFEKAVDNPMGTAIFSPEALIWYLKKTFDYFDYLHYLMIF